MSNTINDKTAISRRQSLKGAASVFGLMALGAPAIVRAQQETELTFAFGPDDSGTLQRLIEDYNASNEAGNQLRYREMPRLSDEYFREIESEFYAGSTDIDLFGGDVVWTAEFAFQGWIADLSGRFNRDYDRGAFIAPALNSGIYRHQIRAVPWFTDAGLLYYRRDLLEEAGYDAPPETWDALAEMAATIQESSGIAHGLVFQGDNYEGGTANALEFLWGAGGRVLSDPSSVVAPGTTQSLDVNVISIGSEASARGFDRAAALVAEGVAPPSVRQMRELEAQEIFLAGDAVFMRNWPFAYQMLLQGGLSAEQIGIAPIPASAGQRAFSCLGGWNMMVNARSEKKDAAWDFIRYATSPDVQKMRALDGAFLPSLAALYDDPDIAATPLADIGRSAVSQARTRPVSPYYSRLSPRISSTFNRVLGGEMSGTDAVARLQSEMRAIIRNAR